PWLPAVVFFCQKTPANWRRAAQGPRPRAGARGGGKTGGGGGGKRKLAWWGCLRETGAGPPPNRWEKQGV
ncbi:hypothetical protein AAY51_23695, partial [Vibrio parahaemolyticus]